MSATVARSRLTQLDIDVLDELCQTRVTRSAVILTDDLTKRGRLSPWGDPFGVVADSIESLGEAGLVRYELGYGDCPVQIRVTSLGYRTLGYAIKQREVGQSAGPSRDYAPRHPGDRTDYQTHTDHAIGGPIEREPLGLHLIHYPDHAAIHPTWLELQVEREGDGMMTRQPQKYRDPNLVAAIVNDYRGGLSQKAVAAKYGIPAGSVDGLARRFDRERREAREQQETVGVAAWITADARLRDLASLSLKEQVALLVDIRGRYDDARDIARDLVKLQQRGDVHEVAHVLHSLSREGRVAFVQAKIGGVSGYRKIRPTRLTSRVAPELPAEKPNGEVDDRDEQIEGEKPPADGIDQYAREVDSFYTQEPERVEPASQPEAATRPPVAAENVVADVTEEAWPELTRLRERASARQDAQQRAEKLMEAASDLEAFDYEASRSLVERAEQAMKEHVLSRVEDEYLRYAQSMEGRA